MNETPMPDTITNTSGTYLRSHVLAERLGLPLIDILEYRMNKVITEQPCGEDPEEYRIALIASAARIDINEHYIRDNWTDLFRYVESLAVVREHTDSPMTQAELDRFIAGRKLRCTVCGNPDANEMGLCESHAMEWHDAADAGEL